MTSFLYAGHEHSALQLRSITSSSETSSSSSGTTFSGSSSSTIPGIGALTGKALKAFGEATLRFADTVVIRQRLADIRSHFPHKDWTAVRNAAQMYDELLELSRPDVYDAKIRRRAFQFIIDQIHLEETGGLVQALHKFPLLEIQFFVWEIMSAATSIQPIHDGNSERPRTLSSPPSSSSLRHANQYSRTRSDALASLRSTSPQSSYAPTTSTKDSGTSSRTLLAPTSLPGKVLGVFGKAALRSAENIVVRRRLYFIRSRFPIYESDSRAIKNVEEMYNDLLELSRTDLYSPQITRRALRVILTQVVLRETGRLIQAIAKLAPLEIYYFTSEFMATTYMDWNQHARPIHLWLRDSWSGHTLSFLSFACRLAQLDGTGSTFQYLLHEGLLEMILNVCIREADPWVTETLRICNDTLLACELSEESCDAIYEHALCNLWPSHLPFFLRTARITGPNLDRRRGWRKVSPQFIRRRLSGIQWILDLPHVWLTTVSGLMDICVDLLEFSSWNTYDAEIAKKAAGLLDRFRQDDEDFRLTYDACHREILMEPTTLLQGFDHLLST